MKRVAARKRWMVTLIAALTIAAFFPASAEAAKYRGIVTCNSFSGKAPDSVCFGGDLPGAVFQAFKRDNVRYRICISAPGGERCKTKTTGDRGERSRVPINAGAVGRYVVTWKVRGKIVATASFRLKPENA